jgi:hypothetical protein
LTKRSAVLCIGYGTPSELSDVLCNVGLHVRCDDGSASGEVEGALPLLMLTTRALMQRWLLFVQKDPCAAGCVSIYPIRARCGRLSHIFAEALMKVLVKALMQLAAEWQQ